MTNGCIYICTSNSMADLEGFLYSFCRNTILNSFKSKCTQKPQMNYRQSSLLIMLEEKPHFLYSLCFSACIWRKNFFFLVLTCSWHAYGLSTSYYPVHFQYHTGYSYYISCRLNVGNLMWLPDFLDYIAGCMIWNICS